MPELSRSQLVAYAAVVLTVVLLGARSLRAGEAGRPGGTGDAPARVDGGGSGAAAGARTEAQGAAVPGDVTVAEGRDEPVLVHVAGAVRRPGVYRLSAGRRVRDAVARAGGRAPGGDVDAINLAAKLADGQRIVVPERAAPASPAGAVASGPGGSGAATAPPAAALGGAAAPDALAAPIDLNSATVEQLDTLDGVGPAIAAKIVAWREEHGGFSSVDDLAEIPGIGPKRLETLRARVTA